MKKICIGIVLGVILIYVGISLNQPQILKGSSENWSVLYKPRKGDEADTEKYPWMGVIKWRNMNDVKMLKVEQMDGKEAYPLFDKEMLAVETGNFNGKKLIDNETFYNPPKKEDLGDSTTFKITWEKDNTMKSELVVLRWEKRYFVKPLF
ncbi:hypothetical protein [Listeria rustica]|uniref:DUF4944 domain-containing protein n=1 Tax=Listeria rustica TaxID=2713503 RepID=A0A7W1T3J6_9LIST|nr:hypothetical protein [Listeria rustica]MBA3924815.1 hypothetical protein [Listeria rustica]